MPSAALVRADDICLPVIIDKKGLVPRALLQHALDLILHSLNLEIARRCITGRKENAVIVLGHQHIFFRLRTVCNAHASDPICPTKILGRGGQHIVFKFPVDEIL